MATISHPAFRILIEKFGFCDEYYTEMINAGSLLNFGPFEKFYIDPSPVPEKVVWQLTGTDKERMTEAARQLVALPGIGLDVNMGCSAPDIYKTGAGIGWMLCDIENTRQMVASVGKVVLDAGKRFSVKLRLGDEDFTDEGFLSFCDMLVENGVQLLTLHPRTKKEKLARPPRYSYCQMIAERYKSAGVAVYLNGNVKDENSFKYAEASCPSCQGVMISRAAVQKPWIFAQLRGAFLKQDEAAIKGFQDHKGGAVRYVYGDAVSGPDDTHAENCFLNSLLTDSRHGYLMSVLPTSLRSSSRSRYPFVFVF